MKNISFFFMLVILLTQSLNSKEYPLVSFNQILSNKKFWDKKSIDVFGFYSDYREDYFLLFTNEVTERYSDRASSIRVYIQDNKLRQYIEKECLNTYVRVKGVLSLDKRDILGEKNILTLRLDGIRGFEGLDSTKCSMNYYPKEWSEN